ncbi:hypothetical protein [Ideonella sp.]|uniref:hypothetical protein n=1 Tax=Ideonella sp. TaxID=1929293 RepID=UPI0035B148BF
MTTSQTTGQTTSHDPLDAERHTRSRRARRVFAALYGLAVACLLCCALPLSARVIDTVALLPAIVAAQVLGAVALLGWLLAWPAADAGHAATLRPREH